MSLLVSIRHFIMYSYPLLLVRDRTGKSEERLNINDAYDSFQDSWLMNQSMELSLTARLIRKYVNAFNLLQVQNLIIYGGQKYVIKQASPALDNGILTNQIKAVHIMYEVLKNIRKENINAGVITYSFQDACALFINNNDQGVTVEYTGDFQSVQIENLGNTSFLDFLTNYLDKFGAVVIPNNLHLHFYSRETFRHNTGTMFVYGGNTEAVHLELDSSNLINECWCYGKPIENNNSNTNSNNDLTTGQYTVKFLFSDQNSINKYGLHRGPAISDERFTDQQSMQQYVQSSLQTEPTVQLSIQYLTHTVVNKGDGWYLRAPTIGLERNVTVTGITQNPYKKSSAPTITLDNTDAALRSISLTLSNKVREHDRQLSGLSALANDLKVREDHFPNLNTIDGGISSVGYPRNS